MISSPNRKVRARAIAEAAFAYPPTHRATFLSRACGEDTELAELVLVMLRERADRTEEPTDDSSQTRRRWVAPVLVVVLIAAGAGGWLYTAYERDVARDESLRAHATADRLSDLVERSVDHLERTEPAVADSVLRSLLDLRLESLGHGHPSTRQVRRDLARIASRSGSYTRAESLRREQIADAEDLLGPSHPEVADELVDLGQLMIDEGKLEGALESATRAVEIYERNHTGIDRKGEAHLLVARARLGLADVAGAEVSFHAAVAALREVAQKSRTLADALEDLGTVYAEADRAADADVVWTEALGVRRSDSSGDPVDLARVTARVAGVRSRLGAPEEAAALWRDAVEIYRRSSGDTDVQTLDAMTESGILLTRLGRSLEAEPLFQSVIAHRRHASSLALARAYAALGYLYHDEDRLGVAETHLRLALDHHLEAVGLYEDGTVSCMIALADVLGDLCRVDEAERLYDHALAVCDSIFTEPHPTRTAALVGLGALLSDNERITEAEPLLRQAHLTSQSVLGATHPETLAAGTTLALCLSELGDSFEATQILQANLTALTRCCGEDDPETIRARDALWGLLPGSSP